MTAAELLTHIDEARSSLVEADRLDALGGPRRAKTAKLLRTHAWLWLAEASAAAQEAAGR